MNPDSTVKDHLQPFRNVLVMKHTFQESVIIRLILSLTGHITKIPLGQAINKTQLQIVIILTDKGTNQTKFELVA